LEKPGKPFDEESYAKERKPYFMYAGKSGIRKDFLKSQYVPSGLMLILGNGNRLFFYEPNIKKSTGAFCNP